MDLKLPDGVVIAAVRRGSHTIVPCGIDKIQADDILRVFLTSATSVTITDFLNDIVKKEAEKLEKIEVTEQEKQEDKKDW